MELGHPQQALTDALIDALGHRLPDIEYAYKTPIEHREGKPATMKKRRPDMRDIEIKMFLQTWGSTALGFGGIGGSSMTSAYTVIVFCGRLAAVYWGGGFAYMVEPNDAFMKDVSHDLTEPRSRLGKYLEKGK